MAEIPAIELLAPAGNPSVALAAFDAGADAVYCGLRKFNARERSENFTHEELAKVLAYAHKNRRKLYVTFNTLLKESELGEAAREMAFLAECRPDAVIVQDLGAAAMMRDHFPELTLHASTQLGIHNSAGLAMAKEFGFHYIDVNSGLKDKNGNLKFEYTQDGIHFDSAAYRTVFERLRPYLG